MSMVLNEQLSVVLEYSSKPSEKNPTALGHLAGIGADFNAPTRNGRRYPIELWKNVMASEDFKEAMETHCLFAENDHPADRVETLLKETSGVMTKMEIREKEGVLWCEFDILDTPNGRILKTLLDYGSKIGVSSRGLGDEIERDGEVIIDPDTFIYYGHDFVLMPAVKSARPMVVESKKVSLIESFNKEIDNANTLDEIKAIERVVDKLPELDSIKESINNKLKTMNGDGDNILSKLESDLGKISEENVSLMEEIETLKQKLSANNIRLQRIKEVNQNYKDTNRALREQLLSSVSYSSDLEKSLYESAGENLSQMREVESKQKQLRESRANIAKSNNKLGMVEKKLETTKSKYSELIESYNNLKRSYNHILDEYKAVNEIANRLHEDSKQNARQNASNTKVYERELDEFEREVEQLKKRISVLAKENRESKEDNRRLREDLNSLEKSNNSLMVKNKSLSNENVKLSSKITEQKSNVSKQLLIERKKSAEVSSKYEQELAKTNTVISETLEKYLQTKCSAYGIKTETVTRLLPENYTTEDIDKIVEELADRKRRYDALPFATLPSNPTRMVESTFTNLSPEDAQTMTFLRANKQ